MSEDIKAYLIVIGAFIVSIVSFLRATKLKDIIDKINFNLTFLFLIGVFFSFLSYLVAALNKISLKNRINNVLKG